MQKQSSSALGRLQWNPNFKKSDLFCSLLSTQSYFEKKYKTISFLSTRNRTPYGTNSKAYNSAYVQMHDLFDFSSIAENANLISLITWLVLCEEHISLGQMIKSCISGWLTEQRPFQIRRVINLCIPQYWALSNKCLLYK